MNKNKIIETIFKSEEYDMLIDKLLTVEKSTAFIEDFKQDLMLILLEKEDELIEELWNTNKMKFYITRIILNQVRSSESPFYTKYKKERREHISETNENMEYHSLQNFPEIIEDNFIDEITESNILTYINKHRILTWYETNILSIYYKLGEYKDTQNTVSFRTMQQEYGIHYVSLHLTIKEAVEKIQEHINNNILT